MNPGRMPRLLVLSVLGSLLLRPADALVARGAAPRTRAPRLRMGASRASASPAAELIEEELIDAVRDTDRGADKTRLSDERQAAIFRSIALLEESAAGADLVRSGEALGNYEVAFVGAVGQEKSSPAGGYWRGKVGRLLFRTEALFQHIVKLPESEVPPYVALGRKGAKSGQSQPKCEGARAALDDDEAGLVAVNVVRGRLFGFLPLTVMLCGLGLTLSDAQRAAVLSTSKAKGGNHDLTGNVVRVDFSPPLLCLSLGPPALQRLLRLSLGPFSEVFLDTTYASPRLRLGRGAISGSQFVFVRTERREADDWKLLTRGRPLSGRFVGRCLLGLSAVRAALLLGGRFLAEQGASLPALLNLVAPSSFSPGQGLALLASTLSGILLCISGGGIVKDEDDDAST